MRRKIFCAIAILFVPLLAQANEAAVVRLNGCSGICVSADGLILTADHCGDAVTVPVLFPDGSKYTATLEYSPPRNGIDEAQTYRISGVGGLPFAPVATRSPAAGDSVWSVGYPAGNYQRNAGRVERIGFTTRGDASFAVRIDDGVVTNWQSDGGNSGGPLFNQAGEVVGLLSMSGSESRSYWIGLTSIRQAMSGPPLQAVAYKRNPVVVFTTPDCAPCERLKFDAQSGRLGKYDFQFVVYNRDLKTWSDPAIAAEFARTVKTPPPSGFPVIWVRGTDQYRVGYEPDRRGGLIGWIAGIFDGLGKLIIGERPPVAFPPLEPQPEPQPGEPPVEDAPPEPSQVDETKAAVAKLRADAAKVKEDLERLKSANPIEKARAIFALKADAAAIKADAQTALAEAKLLKNDVQEKPLSYLWGLFGILSGLLHRKADQ
jgi:hypothetical protein